ncbi:hypothetical protein FRC04_009863 [Tulasnella sp. 424]|nr:hypothetical protein FRC04_009863 [Tulasnella sp. 424]
MPLTLALAYPGVSLQEEDIHPPEQGASTTARPPGQRPLFLLDEAEADQDDRDQDMAIDPALSNEYANKEDDPDVDGGGAEIAEEVEGVLHGEAGLEVSAELEQAQADQRQKKKYKELEDKLGDLDEDEDYLEKLAEKKFSRKINYDAIKNLFKSLSDRPPQNFKLYGFDGSIVGLHDNDEDKDDEAGGGMSTIDSDPDFEGASEVHTERDYAGGYSGGGDGDDSMCANDDYYDDGGHQEEV